MTRLNAIRPESMPILGIIFSFIFWIADSAIDTFIFHDTNLFLESLLGPAIQETWSRIQVITLMMIFSLIGMYLLRRQVKITSQLDHYKNELELLVEERTHDLIEKNHQLEVEISEREKIEAELEHQASIDPLTSILNRRKFNETLAYEVRRDERYSNNLSLILIDLDKFKDINDHFGHDGGDEALVHFTRTVEKTIRKTDIFARWGGEEFAILLPETTLEKASRIASKLRLVTETTMVPKVGRMTASFGVAEYQPGDDEESLIKRADTALYKAKKNGRNRVELSFTKKPSPNLSLVKG